MRLNAIQARSVVKEIVANFYSKSELRKKMKAEKQTHFVNLLKGQPRLSSILGIDQEEKDVMDACA